LSSSAIFSLLNGIIARFGGVIKQLSLGVVYLPYLPHKASVQRHTLALFTLFIVDGASGKHFTLPVAPQLFIRDFFDSGHSSGLFRFLPVLFLGKEGVPFDLV
jgi:hypothetical protein